MFSVKFLITKNGGVHFIMGVMLLSTQVPNKEMNLMHMCLVLNNEW